jgi:O-antigen/teichoic acid export membrane protein
VADVNPDRDRQIRRQAIVSTASNYLGQIIIFLTGFVLTPFILSRLGRSDYGLWLLVGSVIAYGSLFDFGITGALTKYVAEYHARRELPEAKRIIATALLIYTLLGGILVLTVYAAAPLFPRLFNIAPQDSGMAVRLVRLMGLGLGLSIPSGTTYAVLRGLQRFGSINLITAGGTVLTALATVVVLLLGGGLLEMVMVNIPLSLAMQIPAVLLIHRAEPGLQLGWRGASWSWVRRVFLYSSSTMAIQTAGQLRNKTDEIVIGAFLPVAAVTPYGLARRLSEAAQMLTHQFLRIILPLASQLEAEQDLSRLQQLFLAGTRLSLVIFLPIGLGLAVLAEPVLTLWVGAEYGEYAYLVWILVGAGFVFVSQGPGSMILQGIARHKWVAVAAFVSGIANLAVSILLVQSLGLLGVALGTLIPNLMEGLFVLPYSARVLRVPGKVMLRQVFLPVLLPGVLMFLVLLGLAQVFNTISLIGLGTTAALGAAIYLGSYYLLGANDFEREGITDILAEVWGKVRNLFGRVFAEQKR